jgi:hypothetical protein
MNDELKVSQRNFHRRRRNVYSESFAWFGVVAKICSESFRIAPTTDVGYYTFTEWRWPNAYIYNGQVKACKDGTSAC